MKQLQFRTHMKTLFKGLQESFVTAWQLQTADQSIWKTHLFMSNFSMELHSDILLKVLNLDLTLQQFGGCQKLQELAELTFALPSSASTCFSYLIYTRRYYKVQVECNCSTQALNPAELGWVSNSFTWRACICACVRAYMRTYVTLSS